MLSQCVGLDILTWLVYSYLLCSLEVKMINVKKCSQSRNKQTKYLFRTEGLQFTHKCHMQGESAGAPDG